MTSQISKGMKQIICMQRAQAGGLCILPVQICRLGPLQSKPPPFCKFHFQPYISNASSHSRDKSCLVEMREWFSTIPRMFRDTISIAESLPSRSTRTRNLDVTCIFTSSCLWLSYYSHPVQDQTYSCQGQADNMPRMLK